MKTWRNASDRIRSTWKTALCGLVAAFALAHCDMQTAGTSVGTGNPTEIQVAFKNDSGAVAITGTLAVYASTQIPVEGYAPAPLVTVDVSGANHASLKASAFTALADTLWPKGSKNESGYVFNVVVTGEHQGAVLKGFTWNKAKGYFKLREEDAKPSDGEASASIKGLLEPLVTMQGSVDTTTFSPLLNYHLFIYGTGFKVLVNHGAFEIPGVPKNQYDGFLIALPKKDHQESGVDSAAVFSLNASLGGGTSAFNQGGLYEQVLLPDSLRSP